MSYICRLHTLTNNKPVLVEVYSDESQLTNTLLSEIVEGLIQQIKNELDTSNFQESQERNLRQEILNYLENGYSSLQNETCTCINPTFLDSTAKHWAVQLCGHPFEEYLPLEQQPAAGESFLGHCLQTLKERLTLIRNTVQNLSLTFHIGEALEFCYHQHQTLEFDLINSLHLCDKLGLANLLVATRLILASHSSAVVLTETMMCSTLSLSTVEYIQNALCAPLSMIATTYGLSLMNHVLLGNPLPFAGRRVSLPLTWKHAPRCSSLTMTLSPCVFRVLGQLQRSCFGSNSSCTPFTYGHIVESLVSSMCWKEADRVQLLQPRFDPHFELAWRTVLDWYGGLGVLQMTGTLSSIPEETESKHVRLVLARPDGRYYYVDDVVCVTDRDGVNLAVTFLLPRDDSLDLESSLVHVEDVLSGAALTTCGPLSRFSARPKTSSSMASLRQHPREIPSDGGALLLESCREFEDRYELEIRLPAAQQLHSKFIYA